MERNRKIIQASIIGVIANVFLAAFKAGVGLLSNSVAIVLDAVNNLSDALSSAITIIGTKLAGKAPDKKHPLGHGRVEYLSATAIAVIVLYAGLSSFVEAVKKILHPEAASYTPVGLVIIAVAVLVKIGLGIYVKRTGRKVNSDALIASGSDAMFDAVISASTLVAAGIYLLFHVSLEAWLGAVISIVIIKSGYEMLRDTISKILGERADPELTSHVLEVITSLPEVRGAYDLILHNYGPDRMIGSVHVELREDMTAREIDKLEREISQKVALECGVVMTGISVYAYNFNSATAEAVRQAAAEIVGSYPEILQMHGLFVEEEQKFITFDVIVDFSVKDKAQLISEITGKMESRFPAYTVHVTLDYDISDIRA